MTYLLTHVSKSTITRSSILLSSWHIVLESICKMPFLGTMMQRLAHWCSLKLFAESVLKSMIHGPCCTMLSSFSSVSPNRGDLIIQAHSEFIIFKSLPIITPIMRVAQYVLLKIQRWVHLETFSTLKGEAGIHHRLAHFEQSILSLSDFYPIIRWTLRSPVSFTSACSFSG